VAIPLIEEYFNQEIEESYEIKIGLKYTKKYKFSLGNNRLLVETKNFSWTKSDNIPSAKISKLKEEMFHFLIAPKKYKKILVMNNSIRISSGESLAFYFTRLYQYIIPEDVRILELINGKLVERN